MLELSARAHQLEQLGGDGRAALLVAQQAEEMACARPRGTIPLGMLLRRLFEEGGTRLLEGASPSIIELLGKRASAARPDQPVQARQMLFWIGARLGVEDGDCGHLSRHHVAEVRLLELAVARGALAELVEAGVDALPHVDEDGHVRLNAEL
eukprot:6373961-Prymnesium_polylepis.1